MLHSSNSSHHPIHSRSLIGALAIVASVMGAASCSPAPDDRKTESQLVEESAALADRFQTELQAELSTALTQTGAVDAIGVCQSAAPAIAQDLSAQAGVNVQRVARKNRNPGNALSGEIDALYAQLEASPIDDGAPRVVHATLEDRFVYLRAIPMKEQPCTTCHGKAIDPTVSAAIAEAYPEDRAVGFEAGELRGAFLIEHPLNQQSPAR